MNILDYANGLDLHLAFIIQYRSIEIKRKDILSGLSGPLVIFFSATVNSLRKKNIEFFFLGLI